MQRLVLREGSTMASGDTCTITLDDRGGHGALQGPAITASEDFAFMLERVPGSYLFIGNGAGGSAAPDRSLWCRIWVRR